MTPNFERIFERMLAHEGGYVDNPKDPGGATNLGVTQKVFNEYLAASGTAPYSVKMITRQQARAIFNVKYWMAVKGDKLQHGWDYAVVDFAYNSGPGRAVRVLQTVLGLTPDGVIGPKTVAAVFHAPKEKLAEYNAKRLEFMKTLPHWPTFKNGWTARVQEVDGKSQIDWERGRGA